MRYSQYMPISQYARSMPSSRYVSVNLLPNVAGDLRTLTASQTVALGRRVTVSEVVAGLITLSGDHAAELANLIRSEDSTDD